MYYLNFMMLLDALTNTYLGSLLVPKKVAETGDRLTDTRYINKLFMLNQSSNKIQHS